MKEVLVFVSGVIFGIFVVWGISYLVYLFVPIEFVARILVLIGFVYLANKIFFTTIERYFKILNKILS
jgi:hypothetical protein